MEVMEGFQKCEMWSKQTKIYISVLKMLSFVVESQQARQGLFTAYHVLYVSQFIFCGLYGYDSEENYHYTLNS